MPQDDFDTPPESEPTFSNEAPSRGFVRGTDQLRRLQERPGARERVAQIRSRMREMDEAEILRAGGGEASYDSLGSREQAVVRTAWDEKIDVAIAGLDFTSEFKAAGDTWVVGDGHGGAVTRSAASTPET